MNEQHQHDQSNQRPLVDLPVQRVFVGRAIGADPREPYTAFVNLHGRREAVVVGEPGEIWLDVLTRAVRAAEYAPIELRKNAR